MKQKSCRNDKKFRKDFPKIKKFKCRVTIGGEPVSGRFETRQNRAGETVYACRDLTVKGLNTPAYYSTPVEAVQAAMLRLIAGVTTAPAPAACAREIANTASYIR